MEEISEKSEEIKAKTEKEPDRKREFEGWKNQTSEKSDAERALHEAQKQAELDEMINFRASKKSEYDAFKLKYSGTPAMDALFSIYDEKLKGDKNGFYQALDRLERSLFEIDFSNESDERVREAKPTSLGELGKYREFFKNQDQKRELKDANEGIKDRSKMSPEEAFNDVYQRANKKMVKARQKGVPVEELA